MKRNRFPSSQLHLHSSALFQSWPNPGSRHVLTPRGATLEPDPPFTPLTQRSSLAWRQTATETASAQVDGASPPCHSNQPCSTVLPPLRHRDPEDPRRGVSIRAVHFGARHTQRCQTRRVPSRAEPSPPAFGTAPQGEVPGTYWGNPLVFRRYISAPAPSAPS